MQYTFSYIFLHFPLFNNIVCCVFVGWYVGGRIQPKEYQKPGNERLFKLFTDIEMPMVRVTGDMELQGIHIDLDYAEKLRQKYVARI